MIAFKQQCQSWALPLALLLALTACFQPNDKSNTELETIPVIESWGAFEHTHADFQSIMAQFICPREEDGIRYIDPMPKLIELAREHTVVMINEAHYQPIHRAFIGELAKGLKAAGYNQYGAETFSVSKFSKGNRNLELSARGYPVLDDGFYTKEPIYGQLIETVIANKFELFAYESTAPLPANARSSIEHRDTEQAKNILAEIQNSQNKKMLIHAGYDHGGKLNTIIVKNGWRSFSKSKAKLTRSQ